jgi:hypothetical protein
VQGKPSLSGEDTLSASWQGLQGGPGSPASHDPKTIARQRPLQPMFRLC